MTFAPGLMTAFKPTESLLLRVANSGYREVVDDEEHRGVPFDPWKKGDPVFVMVRSEKRGELWRFGKRASTPSATTLTVDVGAEKLVSFRGTYSVTLYRIPHEWRKAAASLAGRTFASREEVEEAMRDAN